MRTIIVLSLLCALGSAARAGKIEMCADDACSSKVKREKLDCAIHKNKSKSLKFGFKLSTAFSASVGPEVTFGKTSEIRWNGLSQELIRRYEVLCDMHNKSLVNLAQFNRRYDKLEEYFEKAKGIKEEVEHTVDSRADKAHSELEAASAAHGGRAQAVAAGKAKVNKISAEIEELTKELAAPEEAIASPETHKPAPLASGLQSSFIGPTHINVFIDEGCGAVRRIDTNHCIARGASRHETSQNIKSLWFACDNAGGVSNFLLETDKCGSCYIGSKNVAAGVPIVVPGINVLIPIPDVVPVGHFSWIDSSRGKPACLRGDWTKDPPDMVGYNGNNTYAWSFTRSACCRFGRGEEHRRLKRVSPIYKDACPDVCPPAPVHPQPYPTSPLFSSAASLPSPLLRGQAASWPDLSTPARAVGGGENDAAVVVGIENYDKVFDVPGAKANAKEWYQYLTAVRGIPPQNVKLLTDEDAAKEPILDQARKMAQRAGPEGTLWFIFVGHGAPSSDGKDGLLVGADARQTPESLQARSVPRGELLKVLGESKASSITVLLDACFSGRNQDGGALVTGLQPLQTVVTGGAADPRMVILTAAKGDQYAGALPGAKRPAFSYLALGGLRGWAVPASAPSVTAGDLRRYAGDALEATLRGRKQEPDLMGKESAVLGRSAGERAPDLAALALATAGGHDSGGDLKGALPPDGHSETIDEAGLQWVSIPGGSFMMGSENGDNDQLPRHKVVLPAFQMSKTMVTNKQYKACVDAGACKSGKNYGKDFSEDDQPVVGVDWSQADAFAKWVGGSLPSEAQWEYAARGAGRDTKYPWGNEGVNCERANLEECALGKTAPVCSKPAGNSPQGICDLAGNGWEWVQDWYHDSYRGAPEDGSAWEDKGTLRVIRGGSWTSGAGASRSADRDNLDPSERRSSLGFRTVRAARSQERVLMKPVNAAKPLIPYGSDEWVLSHDLRADILCSFAGGSPLGDADLRDMFLDNMHPDGFVQKLDELRGEKYLKHVYNTKEQTDDHVITDKGVLFARKYCPRPSIFRIRDSPRR